MTGPLRPYGSPSRGVTAGDVERAADALLRDGQRPTIERIRETLGTGSPNTINPMLDAWWKKLSARLDAGPAALHRLPESVAHVAEALWMQALDEARRRAAQEQHSKDRSLALDKQHLEVRSHVLSLREGELESRLHDRERTQAALEAQIQDLTVFLRKEQATREFQSRHIAALEKELEARRMPPTPNARPRPPKPTAKTSSRSNKATRGASKARTKATAAKSRRTMSKTKGKRGRRR